MVIDGGGMARTCAEHLKLHSKRLNFVESQARNSRDYTTRSSLARAFRIRLSAYRRRVG